MHAEGYKWRCACVFVALALESAASPVGCSADWRFHIRSHVEENIYISLHKFGLCEALKALIFLVATSKPVQANTIPIF